MPKKKTPSPKETKQQAIIRSYQHETERLDLIPEPTYRLAIGDKAKIGHLQDVTVQEILHDGKIYGVSYTAGNSTQKENKYRYVCWFDIRKENNNQLSLIKNQDMKLSFFQTTIADILSKNYYFGTNYDPIYQRDYVWDEQDKVKLIDSIFNCIEIGKFAYIETADMDLYYEILDGKQRIRAIIDFYEDRFPYQGHYFSDLSYKDQYHFEKYSIAIAKPNNMTEEQKIRYFLMLNTGGRIMSQEHLQKVAQLLNNKGR